jgi:DMSO/TMAO reductase YedYZ molybdopterin-dependent catalytic subunit
MDDGIPWPLRRMHQFNERLGQTLFSPDRLSPEFPDSTIAVPARVNGVLGRPAQTPKQWTVTVEWPGRVQRLNVSEVLADLPRTRMTTEFKCVEGWSQIVTWEGVRLAEVAAKHGWPLERFAYVELKTHNEGYYVGLDRASALHPQTLLVDRMNDQALPEAHGGPLRLVIMVKYGVKSLKWLGKIRFAEDRPADYWAERGYDWYLGL